MFTGQDCFTDIKHGHRNCQQFTANLYLNIDKSYPIKYIHMLSFVYLCWCYQPLVIWLPLRLRHNGRDNVSKHQSHDCLLNRLFRRRSKKTSKLRVNGLCAGNSPGTGEFPAQMASNAENASIWWRHHVNCTVFLQWWWDNRIVRMPVK